MSRHYDTMKCFEVLPSMRSTCGQPAGKLRSTCGQPAVNLRSTSGQPAVNLRSSCGQPAVNLRSTCDQPAVIDEPLEVCGGHHCHHCQDTAKRHCRGRPLREGSSGPLIGPSSATALPHHCHSTADWLEESLPSNCKTLLMPPGPALPSLSITAIGQHYHSRRQHCSWTNQRAGKPITQWTTTAVPLGSVLAVMAVLPPSQYCRLLRWR